MTVSTRASGSVCKSSLHCTRAACYRRAASSRFIRNNSNVSSVRLPLHRARACARLRTRGRSTEAWNYKFADSNTFSTSYTTVLVGVDEKKNCKKKEEEFTSSDGRTSVGEVSRVNFHWAREARRMRVCNVVKRAGSEGARDPPTYWPLASS